MLQDKFIAVVENHAELLTQNWIREVKNNPLTPGYRNISDEDLHSRVYRVYQDLSRWMQHNETAYREVAEHYLRLGRSRALEGVHLSEVIYATTLSRVELLNYIRNQGIINDAVDMWRALDFFHRINLFFDKIIYFISSGYESAHMDEKEVFKEKGFFDKIVNSFAHWMIKDVKWQ
ncbi:MAG: RsbRD N-terminal domain-containing protein [Bacillota bacterium]